MTAPDRVRCKGCGTEMAPEETDRHHCNGVGRRRGAPLTAAEAVLASYLSGAQTKAEWALLDNLDGDDVRDVAKAAISRLWDANVVIVMTDRALDTMQPRGDRLRAHDVAQPAVAAYLDRLAELLGWVP